MPPDDPPPNRTRRPKPTNVWPAFGVICGVTVVLFLGMMAYAPLPWHSRLKSADDFPSVHRQVMGASSGEVNRLLGPPSGASISPEGVVTWVYHVKGPPAGTMQLQFVNDRVAVVFY